MLLWRGYGQAGLVDSCVDGACRLRRPTAWIDSVGADERDVQAFTPRVAAERGAQRAFEAAGRLPKRAGWHQRSWW